MKTLTAILDSRPSYIGDPDSPHSLLLAPIGSGRLLCHYHAHVTLPSTMPLAVVHPFSAGEGYAAALRLACSLVGDVRPVACLADSFTSFDIPDWLLVADPRYFPRDGVDTARLRAMAEGDGGRTAVHLVAVESNPGGTTERLHLDSAGRVRAIQRYYDARTWNVSMGVVCSLVPVAALLSAGELRWSSLAELRQALVARGFPSRDVPLSCDVLDLHREDALLRLSERVLHGRSRAVRRAATPSGPRVIVAPTARLVGPVVLQDDVHVEDHACIVGPAVIGAGARIGAGAVVAQCVVAPGVEVQRGTRVAHRAVFDDIFGDLGSADPATDDPDPRALRDTGTTTAGVPVYRTVKGLIDAVTAVTGLLLLAPLMALIAAIIRLESRGGALYADARETEGGVQFRCWKFRTMYAGANDRQRALMASNEVDGPQFKIEGDPRITRTGRFLRKVSLDELPQLFNVALGEMSLVGPRPSPFRENQICVPWREARLSVQAGITGLWQVCREDRTQGDFHQWIYYDLLYVQHMSFAVDMKILLATVLTGGGFGRVPVHWIIPQARAAGTPARARSDAHGPLADRA